MLNTRDGKGLKFHYSDHLGSASRVADTADNEIKAQWYTPYGSDAAARGDRALRYKFNDKEHDKTALYYYGARYHDPKVGRLMSADTLLPHMYDSQQLNRFAYVKNNPVKLISHTTGQA